MARQIGLFDGDGAASPSPHVIADDAQGRIAYYPEVLAVGAAAALFDRLRREIPWQHESRRMYDNIVDVPRLTAHYTDLEHLPEPLREIRHAAEALLRIPFRSVGLNLYRDGNDSVAWHNDDVTLTGPRPVIALVSLGATREMHLRRKSDRRVIRWPLEPGSMLVMSGASQECWEHHIPKLSRPVDPRISVALRTSLHG